MEDSHFASVYRRFVRFPANQSVLSGIKGHAEECTVRVGSLFTLDT